MVKISKIQLNNKDVFIIDLSKAFVTLNYNKKNYKPLIKKLGASDLDPESSSFLQSYLTKRHQRARIDDAFSDWESVITGVLQCSILRTFLFNIFMNGTFFCIEKPDLCNYADSTFYTAGNAFQF